MYCIAPATLPASSIGETIADHFLNPTTQEVSIDSSACGTDSLM
jgi:hypothetical protein